MKKVLLFSLVGGMIALASCGGGPSAEEKAAMEQAKLDSIKAAEQAKIDAAAAAAEAEAKAAAHEAEEAVTDATEEVEEVVEKKEPENIIQGKKQSADDASKTNIIESKKSKAEEEKTSGESIISKKKKGAN